MAKRKVILDAFCKAGGAGMGYKLAGFDVLGIDIEPQKNYPFPFIQCDAIDFIKKYGNSFDAIHASPPCQKYSCSTAQFRKSGRNYPDLVEATREVLELSRKPYVIENVKQAPLLNAFILAGHYFGLRVIRERAFEVNFSVILPPAVTRLEDVKSGSYVSVYGSASWSVKNDGEWVIPTWRKKTIRETWAYAMGIDWYMNEREISEAIPPSYTQFIGKQLLEHLQGKINKTLN